MRTWGEWCWWGQCVRGRMRAKAAGRKQVQIKAVGGESCKPVCFQICPFELHIYWTDWGTFAVWKCSMSRYIFVLPGEQSSSICAPGSTIQRYLCSQEHNPGAFVLPGAQSRSICAPGSTNTAWLCSREHKYRGFLICWEPIGDSTVKTSSLSARGKRKRIGSSSTTKHSDWGPRCVTKSWSCLHLLSWGTCTCRQIILGHDRSLLYNCALMCNKLYEPVKLPFGQRYP